MIHYLVIIPTYYYDKGVENILKSLPKFKKNISVAIYDNTQNNKIYNIYLKYKSRYNFANFNYKRNRPVKSAAINWNFGISDYSKLVIKNISFYKILCHQDEYFCKSFFINLSSIIKRNNFPDVVSCSTVLIKKKKILNKIHTTAKQRKFFFDFNFYYILKRNYIGPTSSIVVKFNKKSILFDTSYLWLVDVEYYIKIFLKYKKWFFTDRIFVYSDQLNKNSLTLKLKKKIYLLNKLEIKSIKEKYNIYNNLPFFNIFDIFIWVSIRIYNKIKLSFNYKSFFH
jgi:hypothetical protein